MKSKRYKKTSHRFKLLKAYIGKKVICPGLPLSAIVSSTSRCNLQCPMCPRAITEFANKDIDFSLYKKIIDEGAPYFEFIIPQGGGEPLMNPDIVKMIRYSKERGIRVGLSTNATLLRGRMIDELLKSGLDYIIFAFDGATSAVYETYRKGAKFEETRKNILDFLKRKIETKNHIFVIIQMVRLPLNQNQIKDYQKMWQVSGVDEIRIKEDEICIEGICFEEKKKSYSTGNPCHYLWQGPIYIEENGDVYPCCHAWKSEPLGNVLEEPLTNIWNNEKMQLMRKAHIEGDISQFPECINCKAAKPRLSLIIGSFIVDTYRVRKIIPLIEKISLLYKVSLFEDKK